MGRQSILLVIDYLFIMDRLAVKVFIVVVIYVPFIRSDSIDSSAQSNGTVEVIKPTNTNLIKTYPNPIGNLLIELQDLYNTPNQMNQKSLKSGQQSEEDLIIKQVAGFPVLPPFVETMRAYFKLAYKSYILLQPEIKFGQCLTKYFYMRFPNFMRFFQWQNLSKYIRRVYIASGRMANNVVTRTIFTWFDDTELNRERIAIKMAAITSERKTTPIPSAVQPIVEFYESIGLQPPLASIYEGFPDLFQVPIVAGTTQVRRRFKREAKYPDASNHNNINGTNQKIMENSQIQFKNNMKKEKIQSENFMQNTKTNAGKADIDPDATIDLTNKTVEREAEELFNIDTMFWKSLGFEDSSFKRYSLAYCTRAYVTDSFSRFMKNIILS